jgi:hypothetical protein
MIKRISALAAIAAMAFAATGCNINNNVRNEQPLPVTTPTVQKVEILTAVQVQAIYHAFADFVFVGTDPDHRQGYMNPYSEGQRASDNGHRVAVEVQPDGTWLASAHCVDLALIPQMEHAPADWMSINIVSNAGGPGCS